MGAPGASPSDPRLPRRSRRGAGRALVERAARRASANGAGCTARLAGAGAFPAWGPVAGDLGRVRARGGARGARGRGAPRRVRRSRPRVRREAVPRAPDARALPGALAAPRRARRCADLLGRGRAIAASRSTGSSLIESVLGPDGPTYTTRAEVAAREWRRERLGRAPRRFLPARLDLLRTDRGLDRCAESTCARWAAATPAPPTCCAPAGAGRRCSCWRSTSARASCRCGSRGCSRRAPEIVAGAALAAVVGHLFPLFFGFRGGKGVATGFGALVSLYPLATGAALVLFLAVGAAHPLRLARLDPGGGLGAALRGALRPARAGRRRRRRSRSALACATAGLVILRHAGNLQRLVAGNRAAGSGRGSADETDRRSGRRLVRHRGGDPDRALRPPHAALGAPAGAGRRARGGAREPALPARRALSRVGSRSPTISPRSPRPSRW